MRFGILILFSMLCSFSALASNHSDLPFLQKRWAEIRYSTPEKQREHAFEGLLQRADEMLASHPNEADLLTWHGIIAASYAGEKGGLGALSLVKAAKADFEKALSIDDAVLHGAAHTSLGSLYYQVPGWPLGFGDNKQAAKHLRRGLALGASDIDANYFYGDYLLHQKKPDEAKQYLQKALAAPLRPGRELADKGRRSEIQGLLKTL
jgi:tetratricopeptide (TPR) repeat protein